MAVEDLPDPGDPATVTISFFIGRYSRIENKGSIWLTFADARPSSPPQGYAASGSLGSPSLSRACARAERCGGTSRLRGRPLAFGFGLVMPFPRVEPDTGQHLRAFLLHGGQFLGIEPESREDGRRDLVGLDRAGHCPSGKTRI